MTAPPEGPTPPDVLLTEAEEAHAGAQVAIAQYRPKDARDLLGVAGDAVEDLVHATLPPEHLARARALRVKIAMTRAWILFEESGLAAGLGELETAVEDATELGRRDLVALCHMQSGTLRGRSGDLGGALESMRLAEGGRSELPVIDQTRLLVNRGTLASHLMQLRQAADDLGRAAALAHSTGGLGQLEFMATHNLGYVEFLRGDLPAALRLMDQADAMDVEVERGVSHLDRARVLLEAGLVSDAYDALLAAEAISAASGGGQESGEIELDLARAALLLGDPAEASRRAAAARARFRSRQAAGWRHRAHLLELEARTAMGRDPRGTARLAAALREAAVLAGEGPLARRAGLVLAEALLALGRIDDAREAFRPAVYLARSSQLATRLHVRLVGATIDASAGRSREASATLRRAAADLATVQRRAASIDVRTALAVHGHRLAELDLGLALASGSAVRVLSRLERWHTAAQSLSPVRPPEDAEAADLLTRLRRVREDQRSAPLGHEQEELADEAMTLERRIRALDWHHDDDASAEGVSPLRAEEIIRRVRDAGVVVVSFVPYRGGLHAVVVRPDRRPALTAVASLDAVLKVLRRLRADIDTSARMARSSPLRRAVEGSWGQGLETLDRLLLAAVGDLRASGSPLVVVPTLGLSEVPWGMLPTARGVPVTVARSATTWCLDGREAPSAPRVTALAGPDLHLADAEVDAVGAAWRRGHAVESARSRRADLALALTTSDVVHVAAHGVHQRQSPLFSSLRLGDGVTFAHELAGLRIRASHVVLSACEGGRTTLRPGDEGLGLTASLLALGVSSVVAPLGVVPDDVAFETMTSYHRELATGVDAASALARVTADAPLAAAAFTTFGAPWRVRLR